MGASRVNTTLPISSPNFSNQTYTANTQDTFFLRVYPSHHELTTTHTQSGTQRNKLQPQRHTQQPNSPIIVSISRIPNALHHALCLTGALTRPPSQLGWPRLIMLRTSGDTPCLTGALSRHPSLLGWTRQHLQIGMLVAGPTHSPQWHR